ncbi:MAG: DUF5615 family PIN-like protein [Chloroflexota bacterium]
MLFLVDECTGPVVANWLREQGYEVLSIYEEARGSSDEEIVQRAFREDRIVITNDKDFGEKIFRERYPHKGVILLRLDDERAKNKISALERVLSKYETQLSGRFVVVTENKIRLSR